MRAEKCFRVGHIHDVNDRGKGTDVSACNGGFSGAAGGIHPVYLGAGAMYDFGLMVLEANSGRCEKQYSISLSPANGTLLLVLCLENDQTVINTRFSFRGAL